MISLCAEIIGNLLDIEALLALTEAVIVRKWGLLLNLEFGEGVFSPDDLMN